MNAVEIEQMLQVDPEDSRLAQGRFVSWLRSECGWSDQDIERNELRLCGVDATLDERYRRFWRTIAHSTKTLAAAGIPSITIKSVREYPYADGNVDVLVDRSFAERAVDALAADAWERPAVLNALEQRSVERRKLKLPAANTAYVPAHLYFGLSWRHQPDIGLLRDESAVESVDSGHVSGLVELDGQCIARPVRHADIVLHACHAIYENYRWSVGEAFNILRHTSRDPSALHAARGLAAQFGCESAVDLVYGLSERVLFGGLRDAKAYPIQVPATDVVAVQSARWRMMLANRRFAAIGIEAASLAVFMPLVKTARWWRRGRSRVRG